MGEQDGKGVGGHGGWEGYLTSLKIIGFSYKILIMIINKSLQWGDCLTDISVNHFGILELFLY